ncbi:MAG: hypothetical protein GX235_11150 [Clostridiales bacterium]|nr:hypothetical protein [Clostridiales bacterium]
MKNGDGKVTSRNAGNRVEFCGAINLKGGSISITGGTIENTTNSAASYAIYNRGSGTALVTSENTRIESGTIELSSGYSEDAVLEITGGTIENTSSAGYVIYHKNPNAGKIAIPSGSPVIKGGHMAVIISAKNGNLFDLQSTFTRAEASTALRRFAELTIAGDAITDWTRNGFGQ